MTIHSTHTSSHGKQAVTPRTSRVTAPLSSRWLVGLGAVCLCVASSATTAMGQGMTIPVTTDQESGLILQEGLQQAGGFTVSADASSKESLNHGDQTYRVVNAASYRTAADAKKTPSESIQKVAFLDRASGHCSTCGTSSCGGSCGTLSMQTSACGSCGTSSCGGGCGRQSGLSCQGAFAGVCEPCSPYRYASVEALYMDHDGDDFKFNGLFGLGEFDYEFGSRITFGAVSDCVHGYEASLVGPLEWDVSNRLAGLDTRSTVLSTGLFSRNIPAETDTNTVTNVNVTPGIGTPGTTTNTTTNTGTGITIDETIVTTIDAGAGTTTVTTTTVTTTVTAATTRDELHDVTTVTSLFGQEQSLNAEYWSVDLSRTLVGYEIVKLLYGGRFVNYSEDYRYSATQRTVETRDPSLPGLSNQTITTNTPFSMLSNVDNRLLGMQIGMDLLYPISRHAYSDMRLRAGAYANFAEQSFVQSGSPSLNVRSSDDDIELAGLFEFGSGVRYQLGELLSVRAGVEVWYLSGVATATNQAQGIRPSGSDPSIQMDDDIFFTGMSLGAELRW